MRLLASKTYEKNREHTLTNSTMTNSTNIGCCNYQNLVIFTCIINLGASRPENGKESSPIHDTQTKLLQEKKGALE